MYSIMYKSSEVFAVTTSFGYCLEVNPSPAEMSMSNTTFWLWMLQWRTLR